MVKGTNRRVIVVKSPDKRVFEEAIFILREDSPVCSAENVLEDARRTAAEYLKTIAAPPRQKRPCRRLAAILLLGLGAGVMWCLYRYLPVIIP